MQRLSDQFSLWSASSDGNRASGFSFPRVSQMFGQQRTGGYPANETGEGTMPQAPPFQPELDTVYEAERETSDRFSTFRRIPISLASRSIRSSVSAFTWSNSRPASLASAMSFPAFSPFKSRNNNVAEEAGDQQRTESRQPAPMMMPSVPPRSTNTAEMSAATPSVPPRSNFVNTPRAQQYGQSYEQYGQQQSQRNPMFAGAYGGSGEMQPQTSSAMYGGGTYGGQRQQTTYSTPQMVPYGGQQGTNFGYDPALKPAGAMRPMHHTGSSRILCSWRILAMLLVLLVIIAGGVGASIAVLQSQQAAAGVDNDEDDEDVDIGAITDAPTVSPTLRIITKAPTINDDDDDRR